MTQLVVACLSFGIPGAVLTIWGVLTLSRKPESGVRHGWAVTSVVFGPVFLLLSLGFLGALVLFGLMWPFRE